MFHKVLYSHSYITYSLIKAKITLKKNVKNGGSRLKIASYPINYRVRKQKSKEATIFNIFF